MPFEPRQATRFSRTALANDLDPISRNQVFFPIWEQHTVGPIGIERFANIGNAHGKGRAEFLHDFPTPLGTFERAGLRLPNREPRGRPLVHEIEYGAEPVRAIGIAQAARKPETSIGAADSGTGRVDATATRIALVDAEMPAELPDLVDTKHETTQRTGTA